MNIVEEGDLFMLHVKSRIPTREVAYDICQLSNAPSYVIIYYFNEFLLERLFTWYIIRLYTKTSYVYKIHKPLLHY